MRESRHTDKLGPRWIGWPRLARNGTGRPGNWITRVQRVPPEEWRVASDRWLMAEAGGDYGWPFSSPAASFK